ncbi:metallophosphoesterase family protein [Undibacterium sp. Ji49W]|uniref:metallophosphoesterase family protein n=1 Tax=Undibacterium sp. Ji49W TaxID=3413040 RepID=UPI003BF05A6E
MQAIYFCGDTHGNFQHVIDVVLANRPAAIIFLGDLQARQPLEQELAAIMGSTDIWYIHGNHDTDTDEDYDHLFGSALAGRNLHGRVVDIAGYRIAGLGGVFRGHIWMPPGAKHFQTQREYNTKAGKENRWREGLPRKHYSSIFPTDYNYLASQRADILVSHEAPSSHPHGFAVIDELARRMRVTRSFHGHHHDRIDYSKQHEQMGFKAFGVGFRGVTDINGDVVVAGQYDHEVPWATLNRRY